MHFLASDDLNGRNTGSKGIEKAAGFLEGYFKEHGVASYFDTYRDYFKINETSAFNIVGVVPGNDVRLKEEVILIGAHYDHIGVIHNKEGEDHIANGANDNASGTVTVLELAAHFAQNKSNKRTLVFVLFSAEEMGLLGSEHLATRMKEENVNIYAMLNIEMVGVPMQAPYLLYLTGFEHSNMAVSLNVYTKKESIGFLPRAKEFHLFKRSDNYPFYATFNIPSHTVSSFDFTNFDHYHSVDDEIELMDFKHISHVVEVLIQGIQGMANTPEKVIELKENDF